jgi:hypothetical protein
MELGHWIFPSQFDPSNWVGFVYRIIDTVTNKEYIGKKQFHSKRSKKIKGRKNKIWQTKESDWKKYTSSSATINELIEAHGKERFCFLIESLHKTKASLTYAEVEKMISEDVLRTKLPDGTRKYYNGVIPPIKFLPPHTTSDEEACRLFQIIIERHPNLNFAWEAGMSEEDKELYKIKYRFGKNNSTRRNKTPDEYEEYLNQNCRGENIPMYGRRGELSPRYGSHPFEKLTEEELAVAKEKMSHKGEENGMYGRHPFSNLTDDELAKVKEKMSHKGKNNGMYGKPCYYNMTDEEKEAWKTNIGNGVRGIKRSEETKKRMSEAAKGREKKEYTCPHCAFTGRGSNMIRYHFDNCKTKNN